MDRKESAIATVEKSVFRAIEERRGKTGYRDADLMVPVIVYAASLMAGAPAPAPFEEVVKSSDAPLDLRHFLLSSQGDAWVEIARTLADAFSYEELDEYLKECDLMGNVERATMDCGTPECICQLALGLLDIKPDEDVADFGCGLGSFLVDAAAKQPAARYYGIEINEPAALATMARTQGLDADIQIRIGDMLVDERRYFFDKAFSNYPFGMRSKALDRSGHYYDMYRKGNTELRRPASADWVFNKMLFDSLKPRGRGVAVMTNGAAFNGGDRHARKYFLERGMIEAVIALPGNLFGHTSISTMLLVLGINAGPVRFVDASDLKVRGRRWDSMGDDEIEEVLRRFGEDGPCSKLVSIQEIAADDYNLSPSRYLGREVELENATDLGDLCVSIERGVSIPARDLDEIATSEDSGVCLLQVSDISDGRISHDLMHIAELDSKMSRQCLESGDIVISRIATSLKIAVVEVPEGQRIIAGGNLYIVRLDQSKALPEYVAAFLSSEDGREVLGRMTVGTTILNLPIKNLKTLPIPLLPMQRQKEVADSYSARLDEIEVLKIKLEKARSDMVSAYDEAVGR